MTPLLVARVPCGSRSKPVFDAGNGAGRDGWLEEGGWALNASRREDVFSPWLRLFPDELLPARPDAFCRELELLEGAGRFWGRCDATDMIDSVGEATRSVVLEVEYVSGASGGMAARVKWEVK